MHPPEPDGSKRPLSNVLRVFFRSEEFVSCTHFTRLKLPALQGHGKEIRRVVGVAGVGSSFVTVCRVVGRCVVLQKALWHARVRSCASHIRLQRR